VVCRNGYAHTTTQQIADEAGLTRGAIQHHFNSRVELFGAILTRVEELWTKPFDVLENMPDADIETKFDILLDQLLLVAKSSEYRATIEICLNGRSDPDLQRHIYSITRNSTLVFKRSWYRAFAPAVPKNILDEARNIVATVAQGLIITGAFSEHPERFPKGADATFARVKLMVKQLVLGAAAIPAKPTPASARKSADKKHR
jgi:AcrR family transcriptional regulator